MTTDIKELLRKAKLELENEASAKMTPEDRQLHELCQSLLSLERQLRAPGASRTQQDRMVELLKLLAKESIK
jgi:hypothetical protein